jgi:hypothetical protein
MINRPAVEIKREDIIPLDEALGIYDRYLDYPDATNYEKEVTALLYWSDERTDPTPIPKVRLFGMACELSEQTTRARNRDPVRYDVIEREPSTHAIERIRRWLAPLIIKEWMARLPRRTDR